MITLNYYLLTLLLASASLHAMENVHIEPFDYKKHGDSVRQLFNRTLPHFIIPNPLHGIEQPREYEWFKEYFDVIVGQTDVKKSDETSTEIPLGLIIHNIETSLKYAHYFKYFLRDERSQAYRTKHARLVNSFVNNTIKAAFIHYLCIDPQYQGKGYGKALLKHAEQHAIKNNCHIVGVGSLHGVGTFFKNNGYPIASLPSQGDFYAKPLHNHTRGILKAITAARSKISLNPTQKTNNEDCSMEAESRPAKKLKESTDDQ